MKSIYCVTRRDLLRLSALAGASGIMAACQPKIVEVTKIVEKQVEKIVKETVVVVKEPTKAAPAQPASIKWSSWAQADELRIFRDIQGLFMQANPNIKVDLVTIPGDQYNDQVLTLAAAGTPMDVMYINPYWISVWASKDLLLDLTAYFEQEPKYLDPQKYDQTAFGGGMTIKGKRYATTNGTNVLALAYNKDLFDKAGVGYPQASWTWQDVLQAAKQLTVMEGDKPAQFGLNNPGSWDPYPSLFIWAFGGEVWDSYDAPTKCLWDSPQAIEGLTFLQDLVYKYKVCPTAAQAQGLGGGFESGKLAMDLPGTWIVPFWRTIDRFKWDLQFVPRSVNGKSVSCFFTAGFMVSKKTKFPDAAWKLAAFQMEPAAQQLWGNTGLITVADIALALVFGAKLGR